MRNFISSLKKLVTLIVKEPHLFTNDPLFTYHVWSSKKLYSSKINLYNHFCKSFEETIITLFPSELNRLDEHTQSAYESIDSINRLNHQKSNLPNWSLGIAHSSLIYILVRILKPRVVVETGVDFGFSSAIILFALENNKKGKLYSIDLPMRGRESRVGLAVPPNLRHRWKLIIGSSSKMLNPLLDKIGPIDLFLHDSSHIYNTMLYEYSSAWPHIRPDGLLLSHDVNQNDAFIEFCMNHRLSPVILKEFSEYGTMMGVVKKTKQC